MPHLGNPVLARLRERPRLLLAGLVALLGAGLLAYSQTRAFAWDEGWHLLAAQLIDRGRRPYLDFLYTQVPLNAYWNAFWFRLFGDTWHTGNAVAAIMTTLGVLLTADYLLRRFPIPSWRLPSAVTAVFLVGLNVAVVQYGTIGQAYALCFFLTVAAFRVIVLAVARPGPWLAAAAGIFAGAAINSSLLTAAAGPVFLLWLVVYDRAGGRWRKAAAYLAGAAIPALPLLRLYLESPRQTLFGMFQYHWLYRRVEWEGATAHDVDVMLAWLDSGHALLLGLLALAGLWFVWRRSGWKQTERAEFYLCAWIAGAEMLHIASIHPNFARYYLLTTPFLAILGCAGLYLAASRLAAPDRPFWPAAAVCLLMLLGIGKDLFQDRDDTAWSDIESVAAKVREVTPAGAVLLADEPTYFVSKHPPYPGTELEDSHKLKLAAAQSAEMHVLPHETLNDRIKARAFDTIELADDDNRIEELGLAGMYRHSAEVGDQRIFWGKR